MHTSMRPLLHSGTSGSIAAHSAAGRSARRLFLAPSFCTVSSTCRRSTQILNPDVDLTRTTAGATSASASASDASTTALLEAHGLERTFSFSDTASWSQEAHRLHDAPHLARPSASESAEPQPVASTSAPSHEPVAHFARATTKHSSRRAGSGSTSPTSPTSSSRTRSKATPAKDPERAAPVDSPPRTSTTSGPAACSQDPGLGRLRARSAPPPRPRLRPPPPPLSWPDYPYTRHPVASACSPHDTAGLKLEALFQCVLHYPRVPPKLLRFLRREVPEGPEGQLAAVTATVERLTEAVGREVAVYLIRRNSWVVLIPAGAVAPRMEAVRRLLGLQPGGVPDLLRKNPNLLRMEGETLRGRYDALQDVLYDSVGFDEAKLRALILKYPLILNFKHESVRSALTALRRLCSARPDWVTYYKALSPSQVAFFIRERVVTLLRLEYLLLTGGGSGWTLRDIMKMSNNMFRKSYGGFRSWMQERLRRLRERLAAARRVVESRAAAEGRQLSHEELERVAMQVQAQCARSEQERFHRQFLARREAERREFDARMQQRQRSIEERIQREEEAELQARKQQGEEDEEEEVRDEEEGGSRRRRRRLRKLRSDDDDDGDGNGDVTAVAFRPSPLGPGADGATAGSATPPSRTPPGAHRGASGGSAAAGVDGDGERHYHAAGSHNPLHQQPPAVSLNGSDPLYRVTLGRVWQRPGSKILPEPMPGGLQQQ